ncbi:hypothetical protein EVAR_54513_1 [Eumeta japonica]|uniref:Uncharacterized protein n=1 Tax=Eumeta variegata TaxID=151549 RepID=A0A4C1YK35_EUMVA|nr:hypothetical protein EVAR_54513_1 [Eumeta japonica]
MHTKSIYNSVIFGVRSALGRSADESETATPKLTGTTNEIPRSRRIRTRTSNFSCWLRPVNESSGGPLPSPSRHRRSPLHRYSILSQEGSDTPATPMQ